MATSEKRRLRECASFYHRDGVSILVEPIGPGLVKPEINTIKE
jgi:hypothetical protein